MSPLDPICAKCGRFLTCEKNGVIFEQLQSDGTPYKLWSGDRWACHGCGAELIVGVGQGPIAEHYQRDYQEKAERFGVELRVQ